MTEKQEKRAHLQSSNNNSLSAKEKSSVASLAGGDDDGGGGCCGGLFSINKETLPLKITLFLYYGAMSAILPYLTIHMKDIGISLSQIAIIYAVLPFTAFLGPPIMGFMADKMGQYKSVLVVATVINGVSHTLLLTVPKYSETLVYYPTEIAFNTTGADSVAMLRPVFDTHCPHFINSLQNRKQNSEKANNAHYNSIINVHSCSWGEDDQTELSRSVGVQRRNISQLCKRLDQNANDDDAIPEFICEMDNVDDKGAEDAAKRSRRIRSSIPAVTLNASPCAISIQLNGAFDPDILETETPVTCYTNYTYPTGEVVKHGNGPLTFWLYFVIRVVGNVFMSACFSLLDATTLAMVKASKGAEYGKERILCIIGSSVISPLAGLLVDALSRSKGYTDYSAAFYVADVLLIMNLFGYLFMNLDVEKLGDDIWKNAADLLNYPEVVVFLTMIFIMGNMWGFVESYLFIFLDELHAPKYLLGLTLTVGALTGVPFLYGAEKLVTKAGRVNIIVVAFLFYFIRFFGYSYIPNPFWCFPFEAMEAFTNHLMWVAAATYCAVLSPKGLLGTLTGVMGSLHYGLGKGSGAFIGGYVISMSNSRQAFRYFGVFAGVVGLIYYLINKLWLQAAIQKRNEREKGNDKEGISEDNEQTQRMLQQEDGEKNQNV